MALARRARALAPDVVDALFAPYAAEVPPKYLRALAVRESGLDPAAQNAASGATGLFQITRGALASYNARTNAALTTADLTSASMNVRVAVSHLGSILAVFAKHPALAPDWGSRRFVELLTFGWNAGHNGLARLVGKMEAEGIAPERITVDAVRELAAKTGSSTHLADPSRVAWAKSVAALYFGEDSAPVAREGAGGGGAALALGLAGLGAAAAVVAVGRRKS